MELEEYKQIAVQRLNKTIAHNDKEKMYYACMGLMEETGEVIAELRKPLFKGNFHEKSLDLEEIKSELGDLMWYIALICRNCNINMNQIKKYTEKKEEDILKREKLIQIAIKLGENSGKILEYYRKTLSNESDKCKLMEFIENQYININELAENLGLKIDEILKLNIEKCYSRYNEKGESIRENEK